MAVVSRGRVEPGSGGSPARFHRTFATSHALFHRFDRVTRVRREVGTRLAFPGGSRLVAASNVTRNHHGMVTGEETMFATRWNSLAEFDRLQNEVHRLFDRWGRSSALPLAPSAFPPLNLWEEEDRLRVEAELPGLELDDLEIFVNGDNQLSIRGERKPPQLEQGTWHRRERGFGTFSRVVELPFLVDPDRVEAEFSQGVLTVFLPKREEARPRRIEVKAD
jgi:HSP20 family protein